MIRSFRDPDTEELYQGRAERRLRTIERIARRKLEHLDAARELRDLSMLPGNRMEALKGDRKGQYSIRVNDQFRLCFGWADGDAFDVEIVDYH